MSFKISSGTDKMVGDEPVRLVRENPRRAILNIEAGDHDLWYGDRHVRPGTLASKVTQNQRAEIRTKSEVWVVRAKGIKALCGMSQEVETHG